MNFVKIQNVIFEMMQDRGYTKMPKKLDVDKIEDDVEMLFESSELKPTDHSPTLVTSDHSPTLVTSDHSPTLVTSDHSPTLVIYHPTDSVGVAFVKSCYQTLIERGIKNLVIVKWGKLTPTAKATIEELKEHTLQVFDVEEVTNNVTKHVLVPKHELLSKEDTALLLKKYKSTKIQLPRILKTDPVVRYYGWDRGGVVKITRKTGEITYRCIV